MKVMWMRKVRSVKVRWARKWYTQDVTSQNWREMWRRRHFLPTDDVRAVHGRSVRRVVPREGAGEAGGRWRHAHVREYRTHTSHTTHTHTHSTEGWDAGGVSDVREYRTHTSRTHTSHTHAHTQTYTHAHTHAECPWRLWSPARTSRDVHLKTQGEGTRSWDGTHTPLTHTHTRRIPSFCTVMQKHQQTSTCMHMHIQYLTCLSFSHQQTPTHTNIHTNTHTYTHT